MATVLANPAWPAVGVEVDFRRGPPSVPGYTRLSLNAPYRNLGVSAFTTARGRQYELDKVSAGTLHAEVQDPYEQLNPDNPASPYNLGGNKVTPFRCIRVWAMWPNQPGSGNIINTKVNNTYDPSFELNPFGLLGQWTKVGGTTTLAQSTAQAFTGTNSLLVTQSASGNGVGVFNNFETLPGLTYTFSAYVYLTAQAGLTVGIQVNDGAGGIQSSATTTTQGAWQRLTVTWNAVETLEAITIYGSGTATPTFHVDATQLEYGPSATAFTTTGPTMYPIYNGYVERWPATYDSMGFRVIRHLEAVDALAALALTQITQSYNALVTADAPIIYVPLSNTTPPSSAGALSTGSETAVITPYNISGYPNYFVPPNGTLNWGGDQHPDGTPALSITSQNAANPPKGGGPNQDTGMDVLQGSLSLDTTNGGMIEFWARPVIGAVQLGALARAAPGLNTNFPTGIPNLAVETVNTSDSLGVVYSATGTPTTVLSFNNAGPPKFPDGQWHYFAVLLTNGAITAIYDLIEDSYTVTSAGRIGFNYLCHMAATTRFGDPTAQVACGRWAVYPRNITTARRQLHYWRGVGYVGERSGARVTRLLNKYWQGTIRVASGYLALAPDFTYDPPVQSGKTKQSRFMLDVLQEIQDSERGLIFADAAGVVVFEDRTSRYRALPQTSLWTFGENPTGASPVEYPYEGYKTDHDPTYTFTQANLTRPGNQSFSPMPNPLPVLPQYGQRVLTQTVQCTNDADLTQAGIFYLQRYSKPITRVATLVLNPASNPSLWPVVLSLEISQRVTVKRRNAGLTVSNDYYIEKISHKVHANNGEWMVELQLSPVFVPTAWVLGDNTYGVLGSTTVPIY